MDKRDHNNNSNHFTGFKVQFNSQIFRVNIIMTNHYWGLYAPDIMLNIWCVFNLISRISRNFLAHDIKDKKCNELTVHIHLMLFDSLKNKAKNQSLYNSFTVVINRNNNHGLLFLSEYARVFPPPPLTWITFAFLSQSSKGPSFAFLSLLVHSPAGSLLLSL